MSVLRAKADFATAREANVLACQKWVSHARQGQSGELQYDGKESKALSLLSKSRPRLHRSIGHFSQLPNR
jgi:hypothetical protein